MRLVWSVTAFLLGAIFACGASAQMRLDIERCRAEKDDRVRLRCYDAIRIPGRIARSKYERVDLAELEQYPLSYRGRLVEVAGWLASSGDILVLKTAAEAGDSIPVEPENLSRQDQESILAACSEGCDATIQGRVAPVNFVTGIIADTISPR